MNTEPNVAGAAGRLKTAFINLVDANGGVETAAAGLRVKAWSIYQYMNGNTANRNPPIDIVLALEDRCGDPIVTRAMAAEANNLLLPMPVDGAVGDLALSLHKIGKETAEIFATACAGMSDGTLDPNEAALLLVDIDTAITAMVELRSKTRLYADMRRNAFTSNYAIACGMAAE